jgi:hypothetical protein
VELLVAEMPDAERRLEVMRRYLAHKAEEHRGS